jgi:hypothetical protein
LSELTARIRRAPVREPVLTLFFIAFMTSLIVGLVLFAPR